MPDNNAAAQRVVGNAKAFRDLGYQTFFIGLSRTKELCNHVNEFENFNYVNLHYPERLKDWYTYISSITQYNNYLDKLPDIVIAYNFPAIALNKLRKWSFKKNIRIIADCTEWYEAKGNIIFRLVKSFDTWYRMRRVHFKMDGMIAISDYLYDYYSKKMQNVINIPPLVDFTMQKWNLIMKNDPLNDNIVSIIYAGSPGSGYKDRLDVIIEALSEIKREGISNFIFSILGITQEQYLQLFGIQVPKNLKQEVIFKGRLSHIDTLNNIKKAHFFLFIRDNNHSNRAGFPTKLVESITCGTPVLTNPTSNIKAYIDNGKNGYLLNNLSLIELKSLLHKAIQLPKSHIFDMKNYCYQSEKFNYKNYLADFEGLLHKIES